MRTKVIEIEGASFTISPLSLEQVEDHVVDQPSTPVNQILLMALNNAQPAEEWTEQKLRKELDLVVRQRLLDEVLAVSGLAAKGPQGVAASGEAPAA